MRVSREIRHRAELVAAERSINRAEVQKATASWQRMVKFARRHKLSFDWLACGDLRGLLRQTRRCDQ